MKYVWIVFLTLSCTADAQKYRYRVRHAHGCTDLLLNEATSALDSEVEAAIQQSLYRLMERKTVVASLRKAITGACSPKVVCTRACGRTRVVVSWARMMTEAQ